MCLAYEMAFERPWRGLPPRGRVSRPPHHSCHLTRHLTRARPLCATPDPPGIPRGRWGHPRLAEEEPEPQRGQESCPEPRPREGLEANARPWPAPAQPLPSMQRLPGRGALGAEAAGPADGAPSTAAAQGRFAPRRPRLRFLTGFHVTLTSDTRPHCWGACVKTHRF